MGAQTYDTPEARIAKFKGEILKHAKPCEVLDIAASHRKMPKNSSDTVIYRRWLPYGGSAGTPEGINNWDVDPVAHETQEGVTPDPDSLTPQDVTVVMRQYSCLYMYTDKVADLYEDNIPPEMKMQTGERMGLVREMVRYGVLKGCTNKFYSGGISRSTVASAITINALRKCSRSLLGNRAKMVTNIISGSANYNTNPVEAGFIVFCHTDVESDIRDLPGFIKCAEYGSRTMLHEMEIGSVDRYRFVVSPELKAIPNSGAVTGVTGLYSSGTNVDVYPIIVCAQDAFADVALRGMSSFSPTHIPHNKKDKNDPHGQRGYVGAIFWDAAFIQNDGWMAVIETGITDLAA